MRFLVTAGPTREPIDPVRFISNRSSGKMGYAIAEAALASGHEVILISGPVHVDPPRRAKLLFVSTSDEMFDAVDRHVRACDVFVMCAAVADYKPAKVSPTKIKKHPANFEKNANRKLREKNLDIVVANDVSAADVGMETDENEVTIFFRDGETRKISRTQKEIIARELVNIFANARENCLTKKMS